MEKSRRRKKPWKKIKKEQEIHQHICSDLWSISKWSVLFSYFPFTALSSGLDVSDFPYQQQTSCWFLPLSCHLWAIITKMENLCITGNNWKLDLVEGFLAGGSHTWRLLSCYVASAHIHKNIDFTAWKSGLASPSSILTSLHSIIQHSWPIFSLTFHLFLSSLFCLQTSVIMPFKIPFRPVFWSPISSYFKLQIPKN